MIAWLGMYDLAPLRQAHDRLWHLIRARLGYGPRALTRGGDPWQIWTSPELVLAQTCGFPYRARLHGRVSLVGTPDHGLPGCPPGHYASVLVVRRDSALNSLADLNGTVFAYNEPMSQSGWAAPMTHFAGRVRFGGFLRTGAHAASAAAVAAGKADMAALDALTWALLQQHGGPRLRVLAQTAPTPALPYITARGRDSAEIALAIAGAVDALDPDDRAALHLRGLVALPASAYLAVPTPPPPPPPGGAAP